MSEELNVELINLYYFYKSQKNPPGLMNTIKSFLLEEGINVEDESNKKPREMI